MWKISYYLNMFFTGRRESICASLHRNNPKSWVVSLLNFVFACDENHCEQSFNFWRKENEK